MNNIINPDPELIRHQENQPSIKIVIGAIGGLGMETSNKYLALHDVSCRAMFGQTYKIVIVSPEIHCDVEEAAIRDGTIEPFLPLLIDSARTLERSGVTIIILLCNTLHKFAGKIQESINIPFVSIVQTACEHVQQFGHTKIGIIGTVATKKSGLYRDPLQKMGVEVIEPTSDEQKRVGKAIHRLVTSNTRGDEEQIITSVIDRMKERGAESVYLACTDLQLVIAHDPTNNVFDTLALLNERVLRIIETGIIPPKLLQQSYYVCS